MYCAWNLRTSPLVLGQWNDIGMTQISCNCNKLRNVEVLSQMSCHVACICLCRFCNLSCHIVCVGLRRFSNLQCSFPSWVENEATKFLLRRLRLPLRKLSEFVLRCDAPCQDSGDVARSMVLGVTMSRAMRQWLRATALTMYLEARDCPCAAGASAPILTAMFPAQMVCLLNAGTLTWWEAGSRSSSTTRRAMQQPSWKAVKPSSCPTPPPSTCATATCTSSAAQVRPLLALLFHHGCKMPDQQGLTPSDSSQHLYISCKRGSASRDGCMPLYLEHFSASRMQAMAMACSPAAWEIHISVGPWEVLLCWVDAALFRRYADGTSAQ